MCNTKQDLASANAIANATGVSWQARKVLPGFIMAVLADAWVLSGHVRIMVNHLRAFSRPALTLRLIRSQRRYDV